MAYITNCVKNIFAGVKQTNWELEKLLRSLWWLFHDTYKRRTVYTEITKSKLFPKQFCGTRWVEDVAVGKRAIDMWPHVTKYVKEIVKKNKSEIPICSSFGVIREAVQTDPLTVAKLQFFVFVAELMKPYLTKYQVIITFADGILELT